MAAASLVALSRTSSGRFSPWPPTGCAAPVLVPGDIAATSAAIRMKKPAEAARAPPGVTKTTTGTEDVVIALVMSRVVSTSPPGVSSSMTTSDASRSAASSKTLSMNCCEAGWMVSSTRIRTTSPAVAGITANSSTASPNIAMKRFIPKMIGPFRSRDKGARPRREFGIRNSEFGIAIASLQTVRKIFE